MVLLSIVLDFVQEHRAGRAAERLRQAAHVRRGGPARTASPSDIPLTDVVPGDVVLLSAGDLDPGRRRLLEARDLFVNQALLTGEPFPVEKHADRPAGPSARRAAARRAGRSRAAWARRS